MPINRLYLQICVFSVGIFCYARWTLHNQAIKNSLRSANSQNAKPGQPKIPSFIFHSLPTSSDAILRRWLSSEVCDKYNLTCLTRKSCGFISDDLLLDCNRGLTKEHNDDPFVDYGVLTGFRMDNGCCMLQKPKYNGFMSSFLACISK